MNILISVNDAYYDAAKIMLRSLFRNNMDCNIVIYLFYTKIGKKELIRLEKFIEKNHSVLYTMEINDEILEDVPIGNLSKETLSSVTHLEIILQSGYIERAKVDKVE